MLYATHIAHTCKQCRTLPNTHIHTHPSGVVWAGFRFVFLTHTSLRTHPTQALSSPVAGLYVRPDGSIPIRVQVASPPANTTAASRGWNW